MDMASHMVCFGGIGGGVGVFILFWVHGTVKEYKISVSIAKLKMT